MACEKCHDSGAYVVKGPEERRTLADGSVMVSGPSYSTMPCSCRQHLPPRDGDAAWWSSENVYSQEVMIPIFSEHIDITVDAEVPMSRENYRLHRRGNRYYPTLITVDGPSDFTMHPETARELAQRLIEAADAADAIDKADCNSCGHWYPCDCGKTDRTVS